MNPHLTITIFLATFAVAGMSTAVVGASSIILASGGVAALFGVGIYLAARYCKLPKTRSPNSESKNLSEQLRTRVRVAR